MNIIKHSQKQQQKLSFSILRDCQHLRVENEQLMLQERSKSQQREEMENNQSIHVSEQKQYTEK